MTNKLTVIVVLSLAAIAIASGSALKRPASSSLSQWQPHPGPPPISRFYGLENTRQFMSFPNAHGEVLFHARTPKLRILWESKVSNAFNEQIVALSFWPTWVESSPDGSSLIVAGKRRGNGQTTIMRYRFEAPVDVLDVTNPGQGELRDAAVTQIDPIYDDAVEGKDYVQAILFDRSADDSLLVKFDDSGDVYQFVQDAGSDSWTSFRVASPSAAGPSVVAASGLQYCCSEAWSADHATEGYVYCFTQGTKRAPHITVVLLDADRNGVLDDAQTFTSTEWAASTLSSSEGYASTTK